VIGKKNKNTGPRLKLPEVNDRIGIVLADGRLLSTRVEDVQEPDLLVAPPSDQGVTYLLALKEEVTLEWTTERGLFQASGIVTARVEAGVPFVRLRIDESTVIQRREYVRVECALAVDVRKNGDRFTGLTLDLSGAGVRVKVPVELEVDDRATLVVYLGHSPFEAQGEVVRIDGDNTYAFRFLGLDPREQERLVQYVFQTHRRQHANVRRSA
jgi:c-di-GMP-binding flagellar brake protein YcgR